MFCRPTARRLVLRVTRDQYLTSCDGSGAQFAAWCLVSGAASDRDEELDVLRGQSGLLRTAWCLSRVKNFLNCTRSKLSFPARLCLLAAAGPAQTAVHFKDAPPTWNHLCVSPPPDPNRLPKDSLGLILSHSSQTQTVCEA